MSFDRRMVFILTNQNSWPFLPTRFWKKKPLDRVSKLAITQITIIKGHVKKRPIKARSKSKAMNRSENVSSGLNHTGRCDGHAGHHVKSKAKSYVKLDVEFGFEPDLVA